MSAPFNAADRKSIRAAEKSSALVDRQRGEVLTQLMSGAPGREFIWNKLAEANIFHTTFSTDPLQMAFNEGQRNAGLLLLNDIIAWCPDQFILAMRESNARSSSGPATSSGPSPADEPALGERPDDEGSGRDDQGPGNPAYN